MSHSIREYEGIAGITTFLVGKKLDRLEIRKYLGKRTRKYCGGFATDDGIVAYKEEAMEIAHKIKAGR